MRVSENNFHVTQFFRIALSNKLLRAPQQRWMHGLLSMELVYLSCRKPLPFRLLFPMLSTSQFQPVKQVLLDFPTPDLLVTHLSFQYTILIEHHYLTGIKITAGSAYSASFYYRFPTSSSFSGNAVIGLQSSSGQVFASATAVLSGQQTAWKQVTVTLTPSTSGSALTNLFTVTLDGASASGQTINFAMFSLFPPTFKNRANGMRVDIAEVRCFASLFYYI